MASIFDRYGIKEVCDVTFYDLESGKPVLYLDTLKVSTVEQTAENTSARGGKGNPELIMWDYNKEITVTLEDALFSAKSMAMMFGDGEIEQATSANKKSITKIVKTTALDTAQHKVTIDGKQYDYKANSEKAMDSGEYTSVILEVAEAVAIDINSDKFPGMYKVVGDTFARNEKTGKDEFFQLVINKAKIMSEVTLTMEAEGDPSTFSMNLKVLRPENGQMIELIKYNLPA